MLLVMYRKKNYAFQLEPEEMPMSHLKTGEGGPNLHGKIS